MGPVPSPGGLSRHPDFLRLWGAQILSALGSRITRTALPLLAILSLRATPTELAVLSALEVAPGLAVGLFLGGLVDRSARRPLLIGADLFRALMLFTVPLAAAGGVLGMPQLYLVAALVGAATSLFRIADNTYLPVLVGPELLVQANARLEATESVAEAVGPGLAGLLVQAVTAPVAIALDALSYLASAWGLGRIRTREPPSRVPDTPPSVLDDLRTGVRVCLAHPRVRALLLAESGMYFFGGFFLSLYLLFAVETLGLSAATVGLVIGVGGIGAFAGALLAGPLERWGLAPALVLCVLGGQGANLLIPLARGAGPWTLPLLVSQQLLGDALLGAYGILALSLRQRVLPSEVLGRANATFHALTGAGLAAGALLAGPVAGALGVGAALWVGAAGGLLAVPLLLVGAAPPTSGTSPRPGGPPPDHP